VCAVHDCSWLWAWRFESFQLALDSHSEPLTPPLPSIQPIPPHLNPKRPNTPPTVDMHPVRPHPKIRGSCPLDQQRRRSVKGRPQRVELPAPPLDGAGVAHAVHHGCIGGASGRIGVFGRGGWSGDVCRRVDGSAAAAQGLGSKGQTAQARAAHLRPPASAAAPFSETGPKPCCAAAVAAAAAAAAAETGIRPPLALPAALQTCREGDWVGADWIQLL